MNLLDVDPDIPIYRITGAEYLIEDVKNHCLTLTRIDKRNWLDPEENPFLTAKYETLEREELSLAALTRNMFAQCWSLRPLGTDQDWEGFGHELPAVRIESTPRKLLAGIVNAETNPFINLQLAMGLVQYQPIEKIHAFFDNPDWTRHLQDPTGRGIMRTLLLLRTSWSNEKEARLIFDHYADSAWDAQNAVVDDLRIKVGFNWQGVITGIAGGPKLESAVEKRLRAALRAANAALHSPKQA